MSGVIRPKITKPLPTLAVGTPVRWRNPDGPVGAPGEIVIVRRRKFAKRYGVRFDMFADDPTEYCRRAQLQVL